MPESIRAARSSSPRARLTGCILLATFAAAAAPTLADDEGSRRNVSNAPEFSFARIQYDSTGGWGEAYYPYDGRTWERWETDFPQGDDNFAYRLAQLSSVVPAMHGVSRRITDPDVFRFPFLYMCDPGYMTMSAEEKRRLREYLLAGGFLWVDDFWGEAEWWNFEKVMGDVFPGLAWRDIPADHPILKTVFDLDAAPQIPAQDHAVRGWKHDPGYTHRQPATKLEPVSFRGYFDADDRLMIVVTHNTDIGDGFEREAYGQWYFETYSTKAFMLGVNIVVYAMTH